MSTIITGYKKVEFEANGSKVEGYRVYFASDAENDNEVGMITDNCFLSNQKFEDSHVIKLYKAQAKIMLIYNKYGKINCIREE